MSDAEPDDRTPRRATTWPPSSGSRTRSPGSRARWARSSSASTRCSRSCSIAIFARGHCLLIGVPGLAKTLMIHTLADALNLTFNRIQFTPDLMPSDITGTEVIQEDKATGVRQFKFLHGPDLRQHRAGRRDQPHAAQDPGRPARGDAGAAGHRRRRAAPPARPVLRAGHAEPDRAGRHLSAARGPARPLHVQHPGRLPRRGGGARHRPDDDLDPQADGLEGALRRPTSWSCRRSSARCRWPTT